MKKGLFFLSSVIAAVFLFIAASQIISASAATKTVSIGDRLSMEQSKYTGKWKSNDLTVEYSYSKDQGQVELSGTVTFAMYLVMGYGHLDNFRLGVIFLDENGRVLQETGLATNRDTLDPMPFKRKVNLPPNAVSMAFTYQGKATSSGGNGAGPISFNFSPIR
jgi:hypothetical protein